MTPEMQAKEKQAHRGEGERTRTGPVFVPPVDIYESDEGMTLMADLPGVSKDGLTIDLRDDTLTIRGRLDALKPEGAKQIYREYEEGDFFRQFSLSEAIDQTGITAKLRDGILTLVLPKSKPAQPRRIDVAAE
jgi:HSP20 family protein